MSSDRHTVEQCPPPAAPIVGPTHETEEVGTTQPHTTQHPIPVVEIRVIDGLDGDGVSRLGALIDDAIDLQPAEIVVDLTDCPLIDAAFIELLLDAHRRVRQRGGLLTLRSLSPRLRRNLVLARADRVLDITPPSPSREESA